jgi:outer membrane immunogenic protein
MKKKIPAAVLSLALTGVLAQSAFAGEWNSGPQGSGGYKDSPYIPVAVWTGFYGGVNAGGAWAQAGNQLAYAADSFGGVRPSGGFGGIQVGYYWQGGLGYGSLVLGLEADIQVSGVNDEGRDRVGAGDAFRSRLEDFGTVRGRLGYAMDRGLFYFTGGLAYGSVKNEAIISGIPADFLVNTTTTGYVLGGGLEYKFTPSVSIKGEYQYINLGKHDPVDPAAGSYTANGGVVRDDAFHTIRVGLNYSMNRVYEPLK